MNMGKQSHVFAPINRKVNLKLIESLLIEIFEYFIIECCKHNEIVFNDKNHKIITVSENSCSKAYEDHILKNGESYCGI